MDDSLLRLHRNLLAGDPSAPETLSELLLRKCEPILAWRVRWLDRPTLVDALEDSILAYLRNPARFDSSRGGLETFICVSAVSRALSLHRKRRRCELRERRAAEEILKVTTKCTQEENGPQDSIDLFVEARTDTERRFLTAWLRGDPVLVLGRILGAREGPNCRAAVKRVQERLRIRWRRRFSQRRAG